MWTDVLHQVVDAVVLYEPQPLDPHEPAWSRPVACYVLGSLYLSMFVTCVVLFGIMHSRDKNFSLQKTFYLILTLFSSSTFARSPFAVRRIVMAFGRGMAASVATRAS